MNIYHFIRKIFVHKDFLSFDSFIIEFLSWFCNSIYSNKKNNVTHFIYYISGHSLMPLGHLPWAVGLWYTKSSLTWESLPVVVNTKFLKTKIVLMKMLVKETDAWLYDFFTLLFSKRLESLISVFLHVKWNVVMEKMHTNLMYLPFPSYSFPNTA